MNTYLIEKIIFYFFLYSFLGWIGESVYKSIKYQKIINTGFLKGPLTPIFGIGALIMLILEHYCKFILPEFFRIILYTSIAVVIEYLTSVFFEKIYNKKLWDYSDKFLNINGRICLQFSIYWFLLSLLVINILHPLIYNLTIHLFREIKIIDLILISFLIIDISYSFKIYKFLKMLFTHIISETKENIQPAYAKSQNNSSYYSQLFNQTKSINNFKYNLENNFLDNNIIIVDKEYYDMTKEITEHLKFNELKFYKHHDLTIYDHVLKISTISYKICRFLNLDYRSAARGALLHDFFFYNWRKQKPVINNKQRLHAFYHPKLALSNAEKYFNLNKIEKDIIVKHMWPLTIIPPKYIESFIVSCIDKVISAKELIVDFL